MSSKKFRIFFYAALEDNQSLDLKCTILLVKMEETLEP
jgi:hypothetical protein